MTEVPTWAWCALTYLLATGVNTLAEVLLTRMKLTFTLQLLDPPRGRDDPDVARKDLDAVSKFITRSPPVVGRTAQAPRLHPRRGHRYRRPTASGNGADADDNTTSA
jgi:hypothetical protein